MNRSITKADVLREGNIKVILPWDGRVGEIWTAGVHEGYGRLFGLAGLNGDRAPVQFVLRGPWDDIVNHYAHHNAAIRRAPAGAELGDLVTA